MEEMFDSRRGVYALYNKHEMVSLKGQGKVQKASKCPRMG